MKLLPMRPAGSIARKAASFESEILELRARGYTFEAIREALAQAGVLVSNSTVQREAAKASRGAAPSVGASRSLSAPASPSPTYIAQPGPESAPDAPAWNLPSHWRSGEEVADAFVEGCVTNRFLRSKPPTPD